MFVLNALGIKGSQLYYLPSLHIIVAILQEKDKITLVDVVGKKMPSLAMILGALGCRAQTVETLFSPDLLTWKGQAVPCFKKTVLMVRGDFSTHERPFMLPPTQAF
ncbi:MAG: hypothetical protein AB7S81_08410 [Bdellovibrionales bacterium]